MREEKFHIYLNDDEYSRVIQSLIRLKNSLISSISMMRSVRRFSNRRNTTGDGTSSETEVNM